MSQEVKPAKKRPRLCVWIEPEHLINNCVQHSFYFHAWVPLWLARFIYRRLIYQVCVTTGGQK